jgi:DNA mismatch endonuclease, patch repair protein
MERALREKLEGGTFQNVPAGQSGRMRAIKDHGNKSTEARIRAKLVRAGVRGWRLHPVGLPGKPDILFPDRRLVVFVDGCYWHGCPCCVRPRKVNSEYWKAKIEGNQRRDARNTATLKEQGYSVLRVWEHELVGASVVDRIRSALTPRTGDEGSRRGDDGEEEVRR